MAKFNLKQIAANVTRVELGALTFWFSYETVVAFYAPGSKRMVSENVWSVTTAKHLTLIDGGDKSSRIPHDEFTTALDAVMTKAGLA